MAARVPTQQYSFTAGMLDQALAARTDIKAYYSGGLEVRNMLGLPQGGADMRGGLAMVAELPEAATGARLTGFEFSTEQTYLQAFTAGKIHIYRDGEKVATVAAPYSAADLPALAWTQSLDTMIVVHPDHIYKRLMRQGSHTAWAFADLPLTNVPTYQFRNTDGTLGAAEPTWSTARGWPRSVYLYEGRLYFGGSRSRPQTVWGSSSTNYFSFATTTSQLDDEAVEQTLDGDRVSAIQQIYAADDLFLFTTGGTFVVDQSPVTPKEFFAKRHSEIPAAMVRPVEIEGSVAFLSRGEDGSAQTLNELAYDDVAQGYQSQDLALLASQLVCWADVQRAPVDMAVRRSNETNAAHHVFVVNSDGTMAVLHTKRAQQITGWTICDTAGEIKHVAVAGNKTYLLVKRTIAGVVRYFIERLDPAHQLDCSKRQTSDMPKTDWTGLDHMNGQTVRLLGDGVDLGDAVVSGGAVTTPWPVSVLEAGLPFDWAVETMPIEAQLADGTLIGNRHRITRATVRLADTVGMTVNGSRIEFKTFDQYALDGAVPRFSGLKTIRFIGWRGGRDGQGATVRMTGTSAARATVLSVTVEVAQ